MEDSWSTTKPNDVLSTTKVHMCADDTRSAYNYWHNNDADGHAFDRRNGEIGKINVIRRLQLCRYKRLKHRTEMLRAKDVELFETFKMLMKKKLEVMGDYRSPAEQFLNRVKARRVQRRLSFGGDAEAGGRCCLASRDSCHVTSMAPTSLDVTGCGELEDAVTIPFRDFHLSMPCVTSVTSDDEQLPVCAPSHKNAIKLDVERTRRENCELSIDVSPIAREGYFQEETRRLKRSRSPPLFPLKLSIIDIDIGDTSGSETLDITPEVPSDSESKTQSSHELHQEAPIDGRANLGECCCCDESIDLSQYSNNNNNNSNNNNNEEMSSHEEKKSRRASLSSIPIKLKNSSKKLKSFFSKKTSSETVER